MDVAETNSTDQASVDPTEEIANLLIGDEADETPEQDLEDTKGATEESTDEVEESEEADDTETDEDSDEETDEVSDEEEGDVTWAGVLGIDENKVVLDDNGELVGINVKVDGEVATVGVNDLIAGFQTNKHNTKTAQTLSAERKEFDGLREQVAQNYTKKLEDATKLTEYLQSALMKDYEGIDWQKLRVENPAEYAAKVQDYNLQQQQFQQIMSTIDNERQQQNELLNQEEEKRRQDFLQDNVNKILEKRPDWADQKVAKEAFDKMGAFVEENYGFTQDEFQQVYDARLFDMLEDAMKYHEGKSIANKKVSKPVPKFQKSNGRRSKKKVTKLDKLTKQARNAKGATKRDLQSSAIAELLTNNG